MLIWVVKADVRLRGKFGGDRYVKIEGFRVLIFWDRTDILTTAFVTIITTVS